MSFLNQLKFEIVLHFMLYKYFQYFEFSQVEIFKICKIIYKRVTAVNVFRGCDLFYFKIIDLFFLE